MKLLKDPFVIFSFAVFCVVPVCLIILRLMFKKTITFKVSLITMIGMVAIAYVGFILGNKGLLNLIWACPIAVIIALAVFIFIHRLLKKQLLDLSEK